MKRSHQAGDRSPTSGSPANGAPPDPAAADRWITELWASDLRVPDLGEPVRGRRRLTRLLIRLALVAAMIGATLLLWQESAEAHAGMGLTIVSDGKGSVNVAAQWRDGHPVTEPLGATMTATSEAGQRVGPVPLRPAGEGIVRYAGPLPAGTWSIVVDVGTPAIARCAATFPVVAARAAGAAPSPAQSTTRCAVAAGAEGTSTGGSGPSLRLRLWVLAAMGGIAAVWGMFAMARRRSAVAADGTGPVVRPARAGKDRPRPKLPGPQPAPRGGLSRP